MLRRLAFSAVAGVLMMGAVAPVASAGPATDATIVGTVTTGHSEAPGYVSVTVWDAATNEFRGQVQYYDSYVTRPTVWYRNSSSFDRATSVLVRSGTPVSGIDIQVP